MASADANSTAWLPTLRSFIEKRERIFEERIEQDDASVAMDHNTEDVGPVMTSPQVICFSFNFLNILTINKSSNNSSLKN